MTCLWKGRSLRTVRPARGLGDLLGYHLLRASAFDPQGALSALEPANTRPVPTNVLLSIIETPGENLPRARYAEGKLRDVPGRAP
ncbi:hypothetical protein ATC00_24525 [Sinorhizobium americanum]|nr:hypothetical protein ATC00_24525 [Sinorhizobium americanum]